MTWIASIAPLVTAISSLSGVLAALYVSVKTRREVQADRRLRMLPILAFEPGPVGTMIRRRPFGHRIGGLSPAYLEDVFEDIGADTLINDTSNNDFCRCTERLVNHGQGTAFDVKVKWIAQQVHLKFDSFVIDTEKRRERKYESEINTMPSIPSHISAGGKAGMPRMPVFANFDPHKQIESIDGEVQITYRDAFGEPWESLQEVRIFLDYEEETPKIRCTFGDLLELPTLR